MAKAVAPEPRAVVFQDEAASSVVELDVEAERYKSIESA